MARRKPRVRVVEGPDGLELRVDETFASLLSAQGVATRNVWDAIAAPLLLLSHVDRPRVLMLGLGGGSVARLARTLLPGAELVGVEIDPEVVAAARSHFGLDALGVELHVDDALAFVRGERRRFDAILEDIFIGHGDDVHKPGWLPEPGHAIALKRLREGGLFVSNTLDETRSIAEFLGRHLPSLVQIEIDDYDNRVLVGGPSGLDGRVLRSAVAADEHLASSLDVLHFRSLSTERRA